MLRSWMFIPGSKDKHLQKANQLKADAIIFDLEDAVAESEKSHARKKVIQYLKGIKDKQCFVRVNALSSKHFLEDIKEVVCQELTGIMLPKVSSSEDIIIADYLLQHMEIKYGLPDQTILIVPLIENAAGVHHAYNIANASQRILCLAFGAEDFKLDVTVESEDSEPELHYTRSKMVVDSGAAGIEAPIDAVYTAIRDDSGLKASSEASKNIGFQGKLAIHPKQISVINDVYAYTEAQIREAKEIVVAYEESMERGDGAVELNGEMIDIPVAEKAKKILEKIEMN